MAYRSRLQVGTLARLLAAGSVAGMGILGGGVASASPDGTITVHADSVIRTLPPTFFGINYDTWWDDTQGSAASAAALGQTSIKLVRYPGGVAANWSDWADPYYTGFGSGKISKTSPKGLWDYAQTFGGMALFQTNASNHSQVPNPPTSPLTAPNQTPTTRQTYGTSSGQNQADWVQYNKAQGIRSLMEVGNEQELELCGSCTTTQDPAYQPYIDTFKEQAKAIHTADSSVQVIGPAQANEWYWWHQEMLGQFLGQVGDKNNTDPLSRPDGISLHIYNGSQWENTTGLAQDWLNNVWPNGVVAPIAANDTRPLPVYITEWNNGGGANDWYNPTIGHGLVTADMIGAFADSGGPGKPSVAGEVYWDMHRTYGGYGMLDYGDHPSPTYFAMALWGKMGPQVLSLSQSLDPASTVSTYATRKPDGSIQVMAINKQSTAQPIHLGFDGSFTAAANGYKVYELTSFPTIPANYNAIAPNYDKGSLYDGMRFDGSTTSLPQALPGAIANGTLANGTLSYSLDPYSAVVFDIAPGTTGTGGQPTATSTATATNTPANTATATGTATWTAVPATNTATMTAVPPTATATSTPSPTMTAVPPTRTTTPTSSATSTGVPPTVTTTSTSSATGTPTASKTVVPPTSTPTTVPPTATGTATSTASPTSIRITLPTSTNTPIPPTATSTPQRTTPSPTSVPPTATPDRTLSKGLVGYWRLDDGSGTRAADASTVGNACSLHTGATWSTGHFDGAISLNGAGGYLSCGTTTLPAASAPQSISWWMNLPGSPSGVQNVLSITNDPARIGRAARLPQRPVRRVEVRRHLPGHRPTAIDRHLASHGLHLRRHNPPHLRRRQPARQRHHLAADRHPHQAGDRPLDRRQRMAARQARRHPPLRPCPQPQRGRHARRPAITARWPGASSSDAPGHGGHMACRPYSRPTAAGGSAACRPARCQPTSNHTFGRRPPRILQDATNSESTNASTLATISLLLNAWSQVLPSCAMVANSTIPASTLLNSSSRTPRFWRSERCRPGCRMIGSRPRSQTPNNTRAMSTPTMNT